MGFYVRSLKDFDGESASVQVHAADLNAGNIAAQLTAQSDFGAAINDMSMGSLQTIRYGNSVVQLDSWPVDPWAQRELKWRVDYRDVVTGEPGHFTIPCANAALLSITDRGKADFLNTDVQDFITAAEAYVLSKAGNAINIMQIVMVGRNL